MDRNPTPRTPPLPTLTSLRFFAAFLVFAFHASVVVLFMSPRPLRNFMLAGDTGVSFFFVLSGFVLAWSWNPLLANTSFWRNRAARIVPLHVVVWGITVGRLAGEGKPLSWGPLAAALGLVHAWIPSQRYYFAANLVSWSLGCEVFFYAVFPVAIRALHRVRHLAVAATVLAATSIAIPIVTEIGLRGGWRFWFVYICPATRLPEFLLGIVLALAVKERRLPRLPLGPLLVAAPVAIYLTSSVALLVSFVPITLVPFALVIVAAAQRDISGRRSWLQDPIMVLLGEASFAMYLVHVQIGYLVGDAIPRGWDIQTHARGLGIWWALFELMLAAALTLHFAVERPLTRRLRARYSPSRSPIVDAYTLVVDSGTPLS